LFDRPGTPLAAAPDLFPPDHFNAGVLVVDPDAAVFASMVAASGRLHSYDGGDTGG
jgi:glycogenin glucosyltransferase